MPAWVVTCDPGIDDAVALAVAAGRPDVDVAAVVAGAGNVDAPTAWRNACGLVALAGMDVPVVMGSAAALGGSPIHRRGSVHGPDGLAGLASRLPSPAAEPPRHHRWPDDARQVLAIGPLTDLAHAVRAGRVPDRVVWLGGSCGGAATVRLGAEFNAAADPAAVDAVLAGVPDVRIVPIDVSGRVRLGPRHVRSWAAGAPLARLCAALAERRDDGTGPRLHDPVAVLAATEPELFDWEHRGLRCSRGGDHPAGTLVADDHPAGSARVAVDVDAAAVADAIAIAVAAAGPPGGIGSR